MSDIKVSINNLEGTDMREIVISGLTEDQSDGFLRLLQHHSWESEMDVQEMPVEEIWLQPASDGIDACVIMKMAAGPKRYARFFPRAIPARIEWGWVLGGTATLVWPREKP